VTQNLSPEIASLYELKCRIYKIDFRKQKLLNLLQTPSCKVKKNLKKEVINRIKAA